MLYLTYVGVRASVHYIFALTKKLLQYDFLFNTLWFIFYDEFPHSYCANLYSASINQVSEIKQEQTMVILSETKHENYRNQTEKKKTFK